MFDLTQYTVSKRIATNEPPEAVYATVGSFAQMGRPIAQLNRHTNGAHVTVSEIWNKNESNRVVIMKTEVGYCSSVWSL